MPVHEPVLTGPGAGRTVSYGSGSSAELKLEGKQAGGDWAVVEWRVRAGDEPPIHTHTREDESVYVVEGAITAFVGDQQFEVEAGSYADLPSNVPHGFLVRGEEARLVQTLHPAGAEYFFVPRDESDADPAKSGSRSTSALSQPEKHPGGDAAATGVSPGKVGSAPCPSVS